MAEDTTIRFLPAQEAKEVTAEKLLQEQLKDFVSHTKSNLSFIKVNVTPKTSLELSFDSDGEVSDVEKKGPDISMHSNNPLDTFESEQWDWVINSKAEEFEHALTVMRKIREAVLNTREDDF